MGQWSVGQWMLGDISFQKIYGFYGLRHVKKVKSCDVTPADGNVKVGQYSALAKSAIFKETTKNYSLVFAQSAISWPSRSDKQASSF